MRFKDIAIKSAGIPLNPITGSFLKRYYASKLRFVPLRKMKILSLWCRTLMMKPLDLEERYVLM